jgi:DNA-binding response OmpR family regulator
VSSYTRPNTTTSDAMPRQAKREPDEGPRKTVLIVEDSTDFSNLLKFIVEDEGFEGIQFPVYQDDILTTAKEMKPSLVLMDLALRRKGGMEYINDLKTDPETKDIPILIISGRDLSSKEVMEFRLKGVEYLRKGRVEMDEIKKTIKRCALGEPK